MAGSAAQLVSRDLAPHNPSVARRSIIIRRIWSACLLIAGLNHAHTVWQHGLIWDYGYAGLPWANAAYWSSLTLIDPLVAALLFLRPKFGIVCTPALIISNVAHNLTITALFAPPGEFLVRAANPIIISQIGFMLFVVATARTAWQGAEPEARD